MGARRTSNAHLPKRVYLAHGAYYYVPLTGVAAGKKVHLGRELQGSLLRHAGLLRDEGFNIDVGDPYEVSRILRSARSSAKARRLEFALTAADIEALLLRASGRCELTGIYFNSEKLDGARCRPWVASLDRIDSAKGYVLDNVRLVCAAVNLAINDFGLAVLLAIAKRL